MDYYITVDSVQFICSMHIFTAKIYIINELFLL